MAINALSFSSQISFSISMQRERLSSSFQVSTCGLVELGISEPKVSCFGFQEIKLTRLARVRTQYSTDSKGLSRNSFVQNKRTIHKASRKLQFCKNDSAIHNQLQWKPFLSSVYKKTELGERTFFSSRGVTFDENIEAAGSAHVEPQKESNIEVAGSAHVEPQKVGILLLNLGGPDTLKDVQPFLYNLFADPDIIRLPRFFQFLQRPLAKLISILRAPKSREGYAAIGGGSPLRKITDEQADALRLALEAKKVPAKVYVGMRYWYPFTEEAIDQIKKDGINKLVVLPLYPQFSISTSGSSIRLLESIFREDNYLVKLQYVIIASWYQRKGYIKAMANLIEKELQCFSRPEKAMIFFSAHGVPVTYIDAGDPYKTQMEECVGLIMEELKNRGISNEYTLAYQSRVGPVEWLKPYTDAAIVQLGQKGVKNLLAVPISFVSEHIETLEEIDMEYKELALKSGIENWGRVPALGCEPTFISDLADAVIEALPNVEAMVESNIELEQVDKDFVKLMFAMFLGHILAFLLVVGPKAKRAFLNCKSKLPSNVFPKF